MTNVIGLHLIARDKELISSLIMFNQTEHLSVHKGACVPPGATRRRLLHE